MIVFVLVSGPLGWATTMFLALAVVVLVVVNVKLFSIIRWGRAGCGFACWKLKGTHAACSWDKRHCCPCCAPHGPPRCLPCLLTAT